MDTGQLEEVVSMGTNRLLVKLHRSRLFNQETFKITMRKIWRPAKMLRFHDLGSSLIMVEFEGKFDNERVLKGSHWNFDKNLILIKEFEGNNKHVG